MKIVYLVSSRSCANKDKEKYDKYLLAHTNIEEDGSLNIVQEIDAYESFMNAAKKDDIVNGCDDKVVKSLFYWVRDETPSEQAVKEAISDATVNSKLQECGIINAGNVLPFRIVYRIKNVNQDKDWMLYGIHEIDEEDDEDIVKKIRKKKSQWCDLLIKYIINRNKDAEEIQLFLHDNDVAGYNKYSAQLIDGVKKCRDENLISDEVKECIGKKELKLKIVFFKHNTTSCVMNLIGPRELSLEKRIEQLPNDINSIKETLEGIKKLRNLCKDIREKLDNKNKDVERQDA